MLAYCQSSAFGPAESLVGHRWIGSASLPPLDLEPLPWRVRVVMKLTHRLVLSLAVLSIACGPASDSPHEGAESVEGSSSTMVPGTSILGDLEA